MTPVVKRRLRQHTSLCACQGLLIRSSFSAGEKLLHTREVVRVEQIHSRAMKFLPGLNIVRRPPETNPAVLLVGLLHEFPQLLLFLRRQWAGAAPVK